MRTIDEENALIENLSIFCKAKLRGNAHKKLWNNYNIQELIYMLRDELDEFENAIFEKKKSSEVWSEAADVANFAAMIASNYDYHINYNPLDKYRK